VEFGALALTAQETASCNGRNVLWWWGVRSWTPWNGKIHEFLDDDRAGLAIVLEE
jgi:hypothetical protein